MEPKDLAIRSTLASIYLEQKKYDNAIDEYTRITADRPADDEADDRALAGPGRGS